MKLLASLIIGLILLGPFHGHGPSHEASSNDQHQCVVCKAMDHADVQKGNTSVPVLFEHQTKLTSWVPFVRSPYNVPPSLRGPPAY